MNFISLRNDIKLVFQGNSLFVIWVFVDFLEKCPINKLIVTGTESMNLGRLDEISAGKFQLP